MDSSFDPTAVVAHYAAAEEEYRYWSPEGYLHTGLWRWGTNPLIRRQMLEAANQFVFESLRLSEIPGGLIADLGCGYGSVAKFGAKRFPHLDWLAITLCPRQVQSAQLEAVPRVRVQQGDYHVLGIPDQSLAAAYFLESFCYSTRPELVFHEIFRGLRPGGRITVADGMLRCPRRQLPGWIQRVARQAAEGWAISEFPEVENTCRIAEQCGLILVEQQEVGRRTWPCMSTVPLLVASRWWQQRPNRRPADSRNDTEPERLRFEHWRACLCGALMAFLRPYFGYYLLTWQKP